MAERGLWVEKDMDKDSLYSSNLYNLTSIFLD